MSIDLTTLSRVRAFGGTLHRFQLKSRELKCDTVFAVFVPETTENETFPVIYYLSGLTCTDENCAQKGCAFEPLSEQRVAMVFPDTSPRGETPNDEAWDLGHGAGFYVDATEAPWSENYRMYSYVTKELPEALRASGLAIDVERTSISWHSMGGHGALTIALRNPGRFASVSAFSPIANPTASDCPWGQKVFGAYLGSASGDAAKAHDATELAKGFEGAYPAPFLIDQGAADSFYKTQLHPERFVEAARAKGFDVTYRLHDGFDHSYFFVSTFMRSHVEFHARALHGKN